MSSTKWLIVGGCPRSGTTLLNQILNSHEDVFITNEQNLNYVIHNLNRIFKREEKIKNAVERKKSQKENWTRDEIKKHIFKKDTSLLPILETLYATTYNINIEQKKYIFGDKTPIYWGDQLGKTVKLLNPKFIHITRHPYDVVNSYLRRHHNTLEGNDYWKKSSEVSDICDDWINAWNFAQKNKTNSNFMHLRYEDLISEPVKIMEEISSFLEIENRFDSSAVVKDSNEERSYLTKEITKEVDYLLNSIPAKWNLPFNELTKDYQKIGLSNTKRKKKINLKQKIKLILKSFTKISKS